MACGTGRAERGWRGGCCPRPCSGLELWAAGRAGPWGHTSQIMPGVLAPGYGSCLLGDVRAGQHLWASRSKCPVPPSPVCKGITSFPSIPASGAATRLAVPAPQVGTACSSPRGTQWRFLRGETALGSGCRHCLIPLYLHTGTHPVPAVSQLLKMPTPAGRRSALRPAQIYPLFYIHTPLIFTALLEQYPGLLIMPAPPPPMCIHHAPTKVPSRSRGWVSAGMSRLVWWHPALCSHPPASPPR